MEHLVASIGIGCVMGCFYLVYLMEKRIKDRKQFSMWIDDDEEKEWRSRRRKARPKEVEQAALDE